MSHIHWLTPSGLLFKATENEYVEYQLDAYDSGGAAIQYKVIAGSLGYGLQLFKSGLVQGIPVVEGATGAEEYTKTFTVRAYTQSGSIADRTFSVTITEPEIPVIYPKNTSIGTFYDGYHLDYQLQATDSSPDAILTWTMIDGELPKGITMSSDGKLSGYIFPEYDEVEESNLGWSTARWDSISWDAETSNAVSKTYYFTVRVYDGSRYDESQFSIGVLAKNTFSADSTEVTSDNDVVTIDIDNKHTPFIATSPDDLPPIRQDSNFAFKIVGIDFNGDELNYKLHTANTAFFDQGGFYEGETLENVGFDEDGSTFDQPASELPAGLELDPITGWITGTIGPQIEVEKTYTFRVSCHKAADEFHEGGTQAGAPLYQSEIVIFTLTVLGDLYNTIDWITPAYLGTIDNGSVSEFAVQAVSNRGRTLVYSIKPGSYSKIPQGLQFTPDGLLIGRVTFEYFSLDHRTTTFDGGGTSIDQNHTFTVVARDVDNTVSAEKTFTINVSDYNEKPYENLYLKALTTREHRKTFKDIINNEEIFPTELIYRPNDPYFGKAKDIRFLFAAGIGPSEIPKYIEEMSNNHYTKKVEFKDVKTAQALDENFNVKYEIVYLDLNDRATCHGKSPAISTDITSKLSAQYRQPPYNTLYHNSLKNMKDEVSNVGYANRGAIPQWMVNQQEDGTVLGFTNAVILAYTVPGASKLIAYRLNNSGMTLNNIDFTMDRYNLDNYLSKHYDIATDTFAESKETTFDQLPTTSDLYPYAGAVDVALTIPFDQVNGRTVDYIKLHGGLDGVLDIKSGMRLVFAKQENFDDAPPEVIYRDFFDQTNFDKQGFDLSTIAYNVSTITNDGWNNYLGRYADSTDENNDGADDNNQGYGMLLYELSTIIPGYLENVMQGKPNERAGIWEVTVGDDGIVALTMIQEVMLNQYVQVADGNTYRRNKIYYDPIVQVNNTVPAYSVLQGDDTTVATGGTKFDGGSTRFYDNRDTYAAPGTDEKYLKFPKNNCFV